MSCLYILEIKPLSVTSFGNIFSQSIGCFFHFVYGCLVAPMVKNLPAMQDTSFQSVGQEDPLEKRMATHSLLENSMDREEPDGL